MRKFADTLIHAAESNQSRIFKRFEFRLLNVVGTEDRILTYNFLLIENTWKDLNMSHTCSSK